jgi:hypothetical protein
MLYRYCAIESERLDVARITLALAHPFGIRRKVNRMRWLRGNSALKYR